MTEQHDEFEASLAWPDFREIYRYWRSLRRGDDLPSRAQIDPMAIAKLLPRVYLIDVLRRGLGAPEFR